MSPHDNAESKVATASIPLTDHAAHVRRTIHRQSPWRRVGKLWHQLGPGLTTGAADDDPSGIATYSQAGSRYGFQLLWLAWFTFPFMAMIQEMCGRIGLVTGRGLAANIRLHSRRWVLGVCTGLLFVANTFNIGADLGAMAKVTQLLAPQLRFGLLLVAFTLVSLGLQIFTSYAKYARGLKWLALVLLSYVLTALTLDGVDWGAVLRGALLPTASLTGEQILLLCGVLGTTISPYLFFWQTSQEVEEEILAGKTTIAEREHDVTRRTIKTMRRDTWIGMLFSNLVMFFIILTAAAVLHRSGITDVKTAADAAGALRPLAGQFAFLLFAMGIIGIGLLAIPVLAGSAAYAIAETFRWREGLYRKLKNAYAFYGVIATAMVIGLVLNFVGLDPMKALLYAAIGNGLVAPVILLLIVQLSSDKKLMGRFVNRPWTSGFGWLITGLMFVVAAASLFILVQR